LNLDEDGMVIVSPTVLERLKEVGLPELEILGEVKNPQSITLNIPGISNKFHIFELGARSRDG
jgi:hypothetical protein